MPRITFARIYREARNIIDKNNPKAKISKFTQEEDSKKIYEIIEKPNNEKVKSVTVECDGEIISASNVKQTYVKFIKKICQNENAYISLKNKGWIFDESERNRSRDDYGETGKSSTYVYTNCNIYLLIVKFVKVILDTEGEAGLDNYVFNIEFYSNNDTVRGNAGETSQEQLSTKEILHHIKAYIASKGFTFDEGLIENYYLSLKSKPFVILAGTSGTGKTRLVRLFAEAIGANADNGRYKLVAVRPDWSDSSDLFGYVDINGQFIQRPIIEFIDAARWDSPHPYFLCLDEMNLARVEYYFSDILSILETRERKKDIITTDPLITQSYYGTDTEAIKKYGEICIPENLYIVGTVNMDETTFPFSRKVLDRANTIEFSKVNFLNGFDTSFNEVYPLEQGNGFMKADYVFFKDCVDEQLYATELCGELQKINKILEKANAHVGYRVRDEIVFYMLNNKKTGLLNEDEAFDNEIMQKILPRIQGSNISVKDMLCELFKLCAGEYESYQTERGDISSKMFKAAKKPNCKYKKSAEKIAFMVRRFEEDGFTAYWL